MSNASAALDYRFSAFVFRRAAAAEIAGSPSLAVEAYARALAAGFADAAGLTAEANREFDLSRDLFAHCPQTSLQLKHLAELERAEFEVKSNPRLGLTDLERLFPADGRFANLDSELIYYQAEGRAKLMLRDLVGADAAFQHAILRNEKELSSLAPGADRYRPLHKSEDAYRGVVQISLTRNPIEALKQWEWYRSGDLSGPRRTLDPAATLEQPTGEMRFVYVLLPDGSLNVWVLGDGVVESRRLSVKREQLATAASRFLRECADPRSSLTALRRDARQLYDWLIAPIDHQLRRGRVHVIEPDGPIAALPLQALVDPQGNFLGERFPIVISNGLDSYRDRSQLPPITSRSAALLMANQVLGNELAKVFPPLRMLSEKSRTSRRCLPGAKVTWKKWHARGAEAARKNAEIFSFCRAQR